MQRAIEQRGEACDAVSVRIEHGATILPAVQYEPLAMLAPISACA